MNLKKSKILVIGDVMLDIFSYGEVRRLNPEWPNPLLNITHEENKLGGAGNVAANIASLSGNCHLIGTIGNDIFGKKMNELFAVFNITYHNIDTDIPTIVKHRFIESTYHQQMIRVDYENIHSIESDLVFKKILPILEDNDFEIIVISDYNKWLVSEAIFEKIWTIAMKKNIKILIDSKPKNYTYIHDVFLMKPNFKEFCEYIGENMENTDENIEKYGTLLAQQKSSNIVVTRGSKWASLITLEWKVVHLTTEAKQVFDVTGAGDTFIATIASALSQGFFLEESIKFGNKASGIIVGKTGTEIIHFNEVF